jgi:hypothetical protein
LGFARAVARRKELPVETDIEGNLLRTLHRWATAQDENFTTDAFAHLLGHLVSEEPKAAARILARITGRECWDSLLQAPPESRRVKTVTQDPVAEGVLDIKVEAPGVLVYIEVKIKSDVNPDQLRRYRAELEQAGEHEKALVLLTRKHVDLTRIPTRLDNAVRWFQVGEWLDEELKLANQNEKSRVTAYLIRQFTGFLKERGMSVDKVTWQLTDGVRSLVYLKRMLYEAVSNSVCEQIGQNTGMETCGWAFFKDKVQYNIAMKYSEPGILHFKAYGVNKSRAEQIGYGSVELWETNRYAWCHRLNMESEEVHFFARTKSNQIQCIEQFLKECIRASDPSLEREEKTA